MKSVEKYQLLLKNLETSTEKKTDYLDSGFLKVEERFKEKWINNSLPFLSEGYEILVSVGKESTKIKVANKQNDFFSASFLFNPRRPERIFEISYYQTTCYSEDNEEILRLINLGKFTSFIQENSDQMHKWLKTEIEILLNEYQPYVEKVNQDREVFYLEKVNQSMVHREMVLSQGSKYVGQHFRQQERFEEFTVDKVGSVNVKIDIMGKKCQVNKELLFEAIGEFFLKEPILFLTLNDDYVAKKTLKSKIDEL